eukprot:TRINITY_DN498_c1_g3_i1.p1 TRINITY_DN498_c1_g3~~TRINITY_DN498_c1_g3_i1.p1  ORF type:complete len:268 (+),score=158.12 TRINITY_DN498_c1_g3_i1:84-887(+)
MEIDRLSELVINLTPIEVSNSPTSSPASDQVNEIRNGTANLTKLISQIENLTSIQSSKGIDEITTNANKLVQELVTKIRRLPKDSEPAKQVVNGFKVVFERYSNAQQDNRVILCNNLSTKGQMANVPPEEISKMMQDGQTDQLLQKVFLDSGSQAEAQRVLRGAQMQYREIMQLEREINELHLMFLQFAGMIEEHGEKLADVEQTVGDAEANTAVAAEKIKEARDAQKTKQKRQCALCCCIGGTAAAAGAAGAGAVAVGGAAFCVIS